MLFVKKSGFLSFFAIFIAYKWLKDIRFKILISYEQQVAHSLKAESFKCILQIGLKQNSATFEFNV